MKTTKIIEKNGILVLAIDREDGTTRVVFTKILSEQTYNFAQMTLDALLESTNPKSLD